MSTKRVIPLLLLLLLASAGIAYFTMQYLEKKELSQDAEDKVERLIHSMDCVQTPFGDYIFIRDSIQALRKDVWLDKEFLSRLEESYEKNIHCLWNNKLESFDFDSASVSDINALNNYVALDLPDLNNPLSSDISKTVSALFSARSLAASRSAIKGNIEGEVHMQYNVSKWSKLQSDLIKLKDQCQTLNELNLNYSCDMSQFSSLEGLLESYKSKHAKAHMEYLRLKGALLSDDLQECQYLPPGVEPNTTVVWSDFGFYTTKLSQLRRDLCSETLDNWPI